ncbi:MAG: DNA-binding beta-propeller fold protein YncE [Planctomycetota bacterium]|jgi:DNA-binding beta-propeller fold protein YncE
MNMKQLKIDAAACRLSATVLLAAGLAGCSGGSNANGTAGPTHSLSYVSTGFAELLPHKAFSLETAGSPGGGQIISLRTIDDVLNNITTTNLVQTVPTYPLMAQLPSGDPGNQYIFAKFSGAVDFNSIMSSSPGLLESNSLSGTVVVSALDPVNGGATVIRGRVFIGGSTYGDTVSGSPAVLTWEKWIDSTGNAIGLGPQNDQFPGLGFPGTETTFSGQNELLGEDSIVFVVDSDRDLSTHETFPSGVQIRMEISRAVLDLEGRPLAHSALATTTVGPDTLLPEILSSPPPLQTPRVTPGGGETDVDPLTSIVFEFSEAIQPTTLGDLLSSEVPGLSSAISVMFGPASSVVNVPFHVAPLSPYDLTRWELTPAFNFPGSGPPSQECGIFNLVDIVISGGHIKDLVGNTNSISAITNFTTGEGPGVVNVPVTPDTIYLGRSGGSPGISVIDLNGFGQGTGNPTFDPSNPVIQGNSNYPNNPNVNLQGTAMRPPLAAGTCTVDGGSSGVFTLSLDSSLNEFVARSPVMQSVGDMMLGYSLDVAFNNAPAPFGCQGTSGGNLCAADGFKEVAAQIDGSTLGPATGTTGGTQVLISGGPNMVSWSVHPNPPPLIFPPLCISPFIGGQEPTSVDTVPPNLLVTGDPFGNPSVGAPPNGLLVTTTNVFFQGPSLPASTTQACAPYGLRQQIGQFLYVMDRARNEILVLNSNRMTVIDRILVPDPTALAIGTNLDLLAISSQSTNSVTFIDIDPASSNFHQVVKTVAVGTAPRGIAWEPGNEDILVCNEGDSSLSVISAFSLAVRKVVSSNLDRPFDVVITPRQNGFGFLRNVYFGYIIGRNGRVAVFESGPNSVNGWGYDDIVGSIPILFRNPKTLQPDHEEIRSGFWVVHEGPLDVGSFELTGSPTEGAITNISAEAAIPGQLLINFTSLLIPQFRDMSYGIKVSLGEDKLTGVPVDIAFDNMTNLGGISNWATNFSAGSPIPLNGKSVVRQAGGGLPTNIPRFMFAAVPSPTLGLGGVDVILLDGAYQRFDTNAFEPGVQSVNAIGTTVMMDYFRQ